MNERTRRAVIFVGGGPKDGQAEEVGDNEMEYVVPLDVDFQFVHVYYRQPFTREFRYAGVEPTAGR